MEYHTDESRYPEAIYSFVAEFSGFRVKHGMVLDQEFFYGSQS